MKINDYLASNNLTQTAFAKQIMVTPQAVAQYCAGRVPAPHVLQRIIKKTRGDVTANDFFAMPK